MNSKTIRLLQLVFSLGFLAGIIISVINLFGQSGASGSISNDTVQIVLMVYISGFIAICFAYFNDDNAIVKHREMVLANEKINVTSEDAVEDNALHNTDFAHVSDEIDKIIKAEYAGKQKLDKILSVLCNTYNAGQGVLFKLDRNEDPMKLKIYSSYAFVNTKEGQDALDINDGLVGLAVKEDRDIEINDLPKDAVKIVSGLGKTAPGSVVIIPIKDDQEIKGAIELSFIKPIDYKVKRTLQEQIRKIAALL